MKACVVAFFMMVCAANFAPLLDSLMNDDPASIALCDPLDSEQEEGEKKSKEEPDDKIQFLSDRLVCLVSLEKWKIFLTADYLSLHHPKIHTPPPERFVFPS